MPALMGRAGPRSVLRKNRPNGSERRQGGPLSEPGLDDLCILRVESGSCRPTGRFAQSILYL